MRKVLTGWDRGLRAVYQASVSLILPYSSIDSEVVPPVLQPKAAG